jgi:hypothetical protein
MSETRDKAMSCDVMTLALRSRCERICEALAKVGPKDARLRYRIGVLVNGAQARPAKYGTGAVEQLGRYLGYGSKTLYHYAAVASGWARDELTAVLARRSTTNLPLRWSHIALLAPIEPSKRAEMIQTVLEKNLSPAGLKRLLRDERKRRPRLRKLPDAVLVKRGLRSISGVLRTLKRLESDWIPALAHQPMSAEVSDKLDVALESVEAQIQRMRVWLVRGGAEKRTSNGARTGLVEPQLQSKDVEKRPSSRAR